MFIFRQILRLLRSKYGLLGILYLILPFDAIADFRGPIGLIDDLIVILFVCWRYKKWIEGLKSCAQEASFDQNHKTEAANNSGASSKEFDPYRILELPRTATMDDIDARYRKLASQYHPDKVNHLGKELKDLAHEKMVQIQRAYEMLRK